MWNDSRIWHDSLIWTDTDDLGPILSTSRDYYEYPTIDMSGELSQRVSVVETKTKIDILEGVSANTIYTVPKGFMIEHISFENKTANTAKLSFGTTEFGGELFLSQTIADLAAFPLYRILSFAYPQDIYLNDANPGDDWNGAEFNIYIAIKKITHGLD